MEDQPDGVDISLFHGISPGVEKIDLRTVPDHHLPPECGAEYSRCKNWLIETSVLTETTSQYIGFIPLVRAVLLVEYISDGTNHLQYSSHHVVDTADINCSPTAMYKIQKSFYAVCMELEDGNLSVIEIKLSKSKIVDTTISGPIIEHRNLPLLATASNFAYSNGSLSKYIVFGLGGLLYILDPIMYASETYSLENNELNCSSIQEISVIPGNQSLIAYCANDVAVYYSLVHNDWYYAQEYAIQGRPYVCSSDEIASVFADEHYIQFQVNSTTVVSVDLLGTDYDSGICFQTTFVYNDLVDGTFAVNQSKPVQLSNDSCTGFKCKPLRIVNMYLIIQYTDGRVIVLDASQNFLVIISAEHTMPALATVIQVHSNMNAETSSSLGLILGLTFFFLLVVFAILTTSLVLIYVFWKKRSVTFRHVVCMHH